MTFALTLMFLEIELELKIECISRKINFSIFYKIGIYFFFDLMVNFEAEIDNRLLFIIDCSVNLPVA